MGLLSKNNNNNNNNANTGYDNTNDSRYPSDNINNNTTTGMNQTGYRDEGMGMGSGHANNAMSGGTTQGQYVPPPGQPQERVGRDHPEGYPDGYGGHTTANYLGSSAPATDAGADLASRGQYGPGGEQTADVGGNRHDGHLRREAEGAAIGGVAGHEHHKHRDHDGTGMGTGMGAGTGAAAGALGGHEYNKHHADAGYGTNTNTNTQSINNPTYGGTGTGTGMGSGMTGMGAGNHTSGALSGGATAQLKEGKHLERSGKMEKVLGTVLMSDTMKEKGMAKQQEGAILVQQAQHTNAADHLEGQAAMHRAHAQGLGAGTGTGTGVGGVQPSYGTGAGPITGGGVGGGGRGVL